MSPLHSHMSKESQKAPTSDSKANNENEVEKPSECQMAHTRGTDSPSGHNQKITPPWVEKFREIIETASSPLQAINKFLEFCEEEEYRLSDRWWEHVEKKGKEDEKYGS